MPFACGASSCSRPVITSPTGPRVSGFSGERRGTATRIGERLGSGSSDRHHIAGLATVSLELAQFLRRAQRQQRRPLVGVVHSLDPPRAAFAQADDLMVGQGGVAAVDRGGLQHVLSHLICVRILDLASVSPSVRPISDNLASSRCSGPVLRSGIAGAVSESCCHTRQVARGAFVPAISAYSNGLAREGVSK